MIVAALAGAYQATADERFAARALVHLRAWFVDPDTRMNPSLLYAQAIKGRATGRGIGIIDTVHLVEVARAAELVLASKSASPADAGVRRWFADYLTWMTTHAYGIVRARREEQPRHVLGAAGGGVRTPDAGREAARRVPAALQGRPGARTDGGGRQLPARVEAHEALRLLDLQPRCVRDDLPHPLDRRRQPVDVDHARRPRHAQGHGLSVSGT